MRPSQPVGFRPAQIDWFDSYPHPKQLLFHTDADAVTCTIQALYWLPNETAEYREFTCTTNDAETAIASVREMAMQAANEVYDGAMAGFTRNEVVAFRQAARLLRNALTRPEA